MPEKIVLNSFSLFILITAFSVIALLCTVCHKACIYIVVFLLGFINSYCIIRIYKKIFTEEKEEHERLLKKQAEYSIYHLTTILNNLPVISYVIDTEFNFKSGNAEALKYFGFEQNEELKFNFFKIFEEDTMEQMKAENEFILKTKKTCVTNRLVKLKNGKQNWFKVRKVPILDSQNNVTGFVVFGRNTDAEKNAQQQRETYISTLSHDLKIPTLAQIRALELLVSGNMGKINKNQKEILNLTLDSCRYMYDMLSTILTTYKYENNDIALNFEKIHTLKLLDDSFAKSNKSMRHKNVSVRVAAKDKFVSMYADKNQMKKAFENLIDFCVSNAYINTVITCKIEKINNLVNIEIGFESPYVTPDSINNMFKMYTTSAEKFGKVGSSLNLYLAKQIINAHCGTINIESEKSNYNRYKIKIPCINASEFPIAAC